MSTNLNFSQIEPSDVVDGLAIYSTGVGQPILLMPYPHMFTTSPIVERPLGNLLRDLNRRVITFDPPGAFRSQRIAQLTMDEMLSCALQTLAAFDIQDPVDVLGHSMGGLCALGFTLTHPERVTKLVLVDSLSGGPAVRRYKGIPFHLRWTDMNFWRTSVWGLRLSYGLGNMVTHKKMLRLLLNYSYVDQNLADHVEILEDDKHHPAPVRDRWGIVSMRINYRDRLSELRVPTLVCAGRQDLLLPLGCSQELAEGIPEATLVIFEESGHDPFLEEREKFVEVVGSWLNRNSE